MDNASKALIMAGAILIAVAIVGIGIYIFSSANSLTNDAVDQIDTIAVQMFNNNFYQYASHNEDINGTRAEQLYNAASANGVYTGSLTSFDARKQYHVAYTLGVNGYIEGVVITGPNTLTTP